MKKGVVVTHEASDWALILELWRDSNGERKLDALLIVPKTSETMVNFTNGTLSQGIHVLPTEHIRPGARTACLQFAVADYIRDLQRSYQVLEVSNASMLETWRASGYEPDVVKQPLLRRLCEGPKAEKVFDALKVLHRLADKYKLCDPTFQERANAAEKAILNQRW